MTDSNIRNNRRDHLYERGFTSDVGDWSLPIDSKDGQGHEKEETPNKRAGEEEEKETGKSGS